MEHENNLNEDPEEDWTGFGDEVTSHNKDENFTQNNSVALQNYPENLKEKLQKAEQDTIANFNAVDSPKVSEKESKQETEDFGDWVEDEGDGAKKASGDLDHFAEELNQTTAKPAGPTAETHDDDNGFGEFSDKEDAEPKSSVT